ncbi:MAG: branched-chain amino acid ABC transporter permease [Acidimicrobiia bacterium]|nr:branched-chain amino acid ABC transporter permease [Acidimicrobiia bacterium]
MEYGLSVATVFSIMVVLAMSCYVVILAGEISFGQHAFFGVGAYVAAVCTVFLNSGLGMALVAGTAAAALTAYVAGMPILRSHGLQFTIYTLIFAEFVRQVMLMSEWRVVRDGREIGPQGMLGFSGIDYFFVAGMGVIGQAVLCGTIAIVVVIAVGLLRRSHFGRTIEAVAEDPILAAAIGINPQTTRLVAFTISGGLAGLGGGLFAHYVTYINPENFGLMFGIHAVAYTLLGGVGSVLGPVLGAALDIVLLEQLRVFGGYRMIAFGALIVFVLILRPSGLIDRPLSSWSKGLHHVMLSKR